MFDTQQFAKEILKYLGDKIPEVPYSTALEIAEFLTCKTLNVTVNAVDKAVRERDKIWKAEMQRQFKKPRRDIARRGETLDG